MNKAKLKTYAPAARRDFIRAVTDRAHLLGLSVGHTEPIEVSGEVALIGGRAYPKKIAAQRQGLEARIRRDGFGPVMEAVAYTWFNRFAALRYMDLHGYLDHGYRVLSHPEGGALPEILEQAAELSENLPGLNRDQIVQLKLAGNQDAELYRRLLVAQCNQLAVAMPFLFERIDDETELLLPDNLLHSDSLIRKLVNEIDEADWQQVEIIGWLYQFYISEKKDQVIGKVVKSEDIPAATQLFTPNWIVQYMVQNSIGRLWLMANPGSTLKTRMPYYIEPAEQTEEVGAALAALTQARMDEDGGSLNPEDITVLDPACGSGHILVEAYEVLKAIYLERGYQPRAIPRLILEHNLYGLDIDDRAAQLAGFALLMKARADDRRLLESAPQLHVFSLQESKGLDPASLAQALLPSPPGAGGEETPVGAVIRQLIDTFTHAKTFGSLIQIPANLAPLLPTLAEALKLAQESDDLHGRVAAEDLLPLVRQAQILAMQFDAVVANPPYMGGKFMNTRVREFVKDKFPRSKSDLFAVSAERYLEFAKPMGFVGLMTPFTWMFLKSYEELRNLLLDAKTLHSLIHPEYHAIWSSAAVPICTFVAQNKRVGHYLASFIKLTDFYGEEVQSEKTLEAISNPNCGWMHRAIPDDFKKVPGNPVAYWMSNKVRKAFEIGTPLGDISSPRKGNSTSDNDRFLRYWPEVCSSRMGLNLESYSSDYRWIPYNKGGGFLKWYGHNSYLIDWKDEGREIRKIPIAVIANEALFFKPGLTWGTVTSAHFSIRWFEQGFIFDNGGCCVFGAHEIRFYLMALLNSCVFPAVIGGINPTLNFQSGDVSKFPVIMSDSVKPIVSSNAANLLVCARSDWDAYERSWNFQSPPILTIATEPSPTLESIYNTWVTQNRQNIAEMKRLEEENNRLFIEAYNLADELSPDVPIEQITLTVNPAYRYGGKSTDEEQWVRFREDSMEELISYAIGCMMGRYSLDEPGLIYAHAGNVGFDPARYPTFPADADGIVPITDDPWFPDDAAQRIREFLLAVWGAETLEENLLWLAESLGKKAGETAMETIRRYLSDSFFKHHLQTYKKRPIYWHFSSGKQGAFQALVYLHRYHEGTLARLRGEYVVPLQGKLAARISHLQDEIAAAPSTAARNKLQKQLDALKKKQTELIAYDDLLRHYADQRIPLDLDDGVKVNYGKFGNLLAEVKAVTGGASED